MHKRFVVPVAASLLLLAFVQPVAAALPSRQPAPASSTAFVLDQLGQRYPVYVSTRRGILNDKGKRLHYTATLFGAMPVLGAAAEVPDVSGTSGGCENSSSYVVQICLTQYWDDYYSGGTRYVAVSYYSTKYVRLDSQVGLKSGATRAAVLGRCGRGCSGSLNLNQTATVSYPTSGQVYNFTPSWHGKYTSVSARYNYQCANSTLTYTRGTSTYTFAHTNVCQGTL